MTPKPEIAAMVLMMICENGFYPIESVENIPLEQQAKDHGNINQHIRRIEDIEGNILWTREQ